MIVVDALAPQGYEGRLIVIKKKKKRKKDLIYNSITAANAMVPLHY